MWFNQKEKILKWRDFRRTLKEWPNDIEKVAEVWSNAPLVNHYLHYDEVESWPDAWTLITENNYCEIAVSLGMFYTLYYSDYPQKKSMMLQGFKLQNSHRYYNLLVCEDEKYVLNLNVGKVVNILNVPEFADPIYCFTEKNLKV